MIRSGELVSFKIGSARRIAVDELMAFVRRRQAEQSEAA
jgi:hypothetical protein